MFHRRRFCMYITCTCLTIDSVSDISVCFRFSTSETNSSYKPPFSLWRYIVYSYDLPHLTRVSKLINDVLTKYIVNQVQKRS